MIFSPGGRFIYNDYPFPKKIYFQVIGLGNLNIGTMWKHGAKNTLPVPLQGYDTLNVLELPCVSDKVLKKISIEIFAADVYMGILGLNMVSGIC